MSSCDRVEGWNSVEGSVGKVSSDARSGTVISKSQLALMGESVDGSLRDMALGESHFPVMRTLQGLGKYELETSAWEWDGRQRSRSLCLCPFSVSESRGKQEVLSSS